MKAFLASTFLAICSFAANANPVIDFGNTCLREGLCLGTPIEELTKLPLQTASIGRIEFNDKAIIKTLAVDHNENKIVFSGDTFDRKSIPLFLKKVKSICSISGFNDRWKVKLKAQDGRDIRVILDPYIYDNRSQLVVSRIEMDLPSNTSKADEAAFYEQLKKAYREYVGPPRREKQGQPSVEYKKEYMTGARLVITAPAKYFDIESNQKITEMPGCTEKLKL